MSSSFVPNGASLEDCHCNLFCLVSAGRGRGEGARCALGPWGRGSGPSDRVPARPRRGRPRAAGDGGAPAPPWALFEESWVFSGPVSDSFPPQSGLQELGLLLWQDMNISSEFVASLLLFSLLTVGPCLPLPTAARSFSHLSLCLNSGHLFPPVDGTPELTKKKKSLFVLQFFTRVTLAEGWCLPKVISDLCNEQ